MTNAIDPGFQELIDDFCKEAGNLFNELEDILNHLDEHPGDFKKLEQFGQIIDRAMGAAKTLNITDVANFCELGKVIGYKSSQINEPAIVPVVVAILFDAIDLLKKMIHQLKTGNTKVLDKLNLEAFGTRLKWLSEKFKHIERASCNNEKRAAGDPKGNLSQNSIDDLLQSLGL